MTSHVRAAADPMALVPGIREAVRQADRPACPRASATARRCSRSNTRHTTDVGDTGKVSSAPSRCCSPLIGLYGSDDARRDRADARNRHSPRHRCATGVDPHAADGTGTPLLGIGAAFGPRAHSSARVTSRRSCFGVHGTDPLTFASGSVVLAIAGLTASMIPALRAMRVDPVTALRQT